MNIRYLSCVCLSGVGDCFLFGVLRFEGLGIGLGISSQENKSSFSFVLFTVVAWVDVVSGERWGRGHANPKKVRHVF